MINKDFEKMKETEIKIQRGENVKSEDLNKLWNYYAGQYYKICFVWCWSNGFKIKSMVFNGEVLE